MAAAHTRSSNSSSLLQLLRSFPFRFPHTTLCHSHNTPFSFRNLTRSFSSPHMLLSLLPITDTDSRRGTSALDRASPSSSRPTPLLGVPSLSRPIGKADTPPARQRDRGGRSHRSPWRTLSAFRQAAFSRTRRCFRLRRHFGGKSLRGSAAPPSLPEEIVFTRCRWLWCVVKEVAL